MQQNPSTKPFVPSEKETRKLVIEDVCNAMGADTVVIDPWEVHSSIKTVKEMFKRPGTENISAIAGFAEAIRQMQINESMRKKIQSLSRLFEKELKNMIPDLEVNGENIPRAPGYSNIYFPFMSGDSVLINLDLNDIAVSTGSACSSGSRKPSHVLQAMGFDNKRINNSVRFSFGRHTTEEEILRTVDVLKTIYQNTLKNKGYAI